jgi:hypothetical protein
MVLVTPGVLEGRIVVPATGVSDDIVYNPQVGQRYQLCFLLTPAQYHGVTAANPTCKFKE